jgi:hypothetical protein
MKGNTAHRDKFFNETRVFLQRFAAELEKPIGLPAFCEGGQHTRSGAGRHERVHWIPQNGQPELRIYSLQPKGDAVTNDSGPDHHYVK